MSVARRLALLAGATALLVACRQPSAARAEEPALLRVRVLRSLPHDRTSYTQGLEWHGGALLESTGRYGRSVLRRVDPTTGRVEREQRLSGELFGEGLARVGERLVQLTWKEGRALLWSVAGLEPLGELRYEGEGWGLCFDGVDLVQSDGSARLTFRDAASFAPLRTVAVTLAGQPLEHLNELECAEGWIWANVYGSDRIVRVDPASGEVGAVVDAGGLLTAEESVGTDVLNGIAYRPDTETFYLTGKLWPKVFVVVFEPVP